MCLLFSWLSATGHGQSQNNTVFHNVAIVALFKNYSAVPCVGV